MIAFDLSVSANGSQTAVLTVADNENHRMMERTLCLSDRFEIGSAVDEIEVAFGPAAAGDASTLLDNAAKKAGKARQDSHSDLHAITGPALTCMASVQPQSINWLWPQRIARGKITLLCGDPGLGKSFITVDLTARVSTGASWPDDQHGLGEIAGDVILMNAEDDMADTIRPRLDAAGADVSRVHCLEGVRWKNNEGEIRVKSITLADVANIETALQRAKNPMLVCIDPISAYLGEKDSHKNAEIRGLLAPLAALASKYRVAVVVVTHLSKSGAGRAMYRAMGSLAFIAAARAAWLVAKDQENPARRFFLPFKNNIGNDQTGLAYAIVDGRIVWEPDPINTTADEAISCDGGEETGRRAPVRDSAAEWLKNILAGGPMTCADVTEAAKHSMISAATLRMAREQLGIVPYRGRGSIKEPWYWVLPSK